MKKAITILAVLIVLVGAVFAETHTLTVRADVTEVLPAFQLAYGDLKTNTNVQNVFSANGTYDISVNGTKAGSEDANFNLDKGGAFTVTANVINAVKTNKNYTLQFGGGVFVVKRDTVGGKLSPQKITVTDAHGNYDAIKTVNGLTPSSILTLEQVKADDPTALTASATVTFSGKTGTAAAKPVASATYTYLADDTIDPIEGGDTNNWYYADITLLITQN